MRRKDPAGQLLGMQSRYISLKIWCPIWWKSRRFIRMLKMFDLRFVLQSCSGAYLKPEEVDRLVVLAKKLLKRQQSHTSCPVYLPTCDVYYAMHADVSFSLHIFRDIKYFFVNKRYLLQNKVFNESYVNTLSIPIGKVICFYNSKQSDMLNLYLQK